MFKAAITDAKRVWVINDTCTLHLLCLCIQYHVPKYQTLSVQININCTPHSGGTCELQYALPKQGPVHK